MKKAIFSGLLVLGVALLGCAIAVQSADTATLAQDGKTPDTEAKSEDSADAELPYGEFVIPFERGEGRATFARQNDMLRLDVDIRLPYSAGDGQGSRGSCVDLILSVDGLHGRHLFFYPNPIWLPDGRGNFPAYRIEMSYDKDRDEPARGQGQPSFAGAANVKYWDRWTVTVWVDLRYVLVPGNSPTALAKNWLVGLVMGNEAATLAYPSGMDIKNPGKTPKALLELEYAKLPELGDEDENPRDELVKAEKAEYEAMRAIEAKFAVKDYGGVMDELTAHIKSFPSDLWAHYLAFLLSFTAHQRGIPGVDAEYAKYELAYAEACPGQSSVHLEYLANLAADGDFETATAHANKVFASALCMQRAATDGYMRLQWAERCIKAGNADEADKQLKYIAERPELLKDDRFRVDYTLQRAAFAARQGDSKTAVELYAGLIEKEAANLNNNQMNMIQQVLQFQRQAVEQWNDELKYREEDAKKTNPRLVVETDQGKVVIELFEDDAPNTVASLVSLAKKEFYDGLTFHRFVQDFMIQGGDPKGNGSGGPGYRLKSEISKRNHFRGSVAMARTNDPNSQGSQFYICVSNSPDVINLSGKYVVVGRVLEGMDHVDRLRAGSMIKTIRAEYLRDHEYVPETIKD